jgi:hypothetical protein
MAAPIIQSKTEVATGSGDLTFTKPSGVASGNILIAIISADKGGGANTITAPSGWTLEIQEDDETNTFLRVYSKVAGASEPADYTWTITGSDERAGVMYRITGANSADIIDQSSSNHSNSNVSSGSTTGFTPGGGDSLFLFITGLSGAEVTYSAHAMATDNPTWSLETDIRLNGAPDVSLTVAKATRVASSATGTLTFSQSPTDHYAAIALNMRSASTAHTKTLDETLSTPDTLLKQPARALSETISHVDAIIRATFRTLAETMSHSDTLQAIRVQFAQFVETVTHLDTILRTASRSLSETVSHADSVVRSAVRSLIESVTLADTFNRLFSKLLTESLSLVDSIVKRLNGLKTLYETKFTARGTSHNSKFTTRNTSHSTKFE